MRQAKITEEWVKKEVKKILNQYKPRLHWWMPAAGMYGVSGQHDFLICQDGMFWSIETKCGNNIPTDNQITFALAIKKAGGFSLMINEKNIDEVKRIAEYLNRIGTAMEWGEGETNLGHDFSIWRKNASTK